MTGYGQAFTSFDDSPQRFRSRNPCDKFSGALGILYKQTMAQTQKAIFLSNPNPPHRQIVSAKGHFCKLTDHGGAEILGRNWQILQEPNTNSGKIILVFDSLDKKNIAVGI